MTFSFLPRTLSWLLPVKNEKHFLAVGTRLLLILFFQQLRMSIRASIYSNEVKIYNLFNHSHSWA